MTTTRPKHTRNRVNVNSLKPCKSPGQLWISNIGWSIRAMKALNCLFNYRDGARLGELKKVRAKDLLQFENCGARTVDEISSVLKHYGLAFKEDSKDVVRVRTFPGYNL